MTRRAGCEPEPLGPRRFWLPVAVAAAVCLFWAAIWTLQRLQPVYDPANQLMSELVFGPNGQYLIVAFLALALATATLGAGLVRHAAPGALVALPGIAALAFAGAGWVSLATSIVLHVALVALAFIACGLAMVLLPLRVPALGGMRDRWASWSFFLALLAMTALGDAVVAPGLAQRFAAGIVLAWLLFVAWRLA